MDETMDNYFNGSVGEDNNAHHKEVFKELLFWKDSGKIFNILFVALPAHMNTSIRYVQHENFKYV